MTRKMSKVPVPLEEEEENSNSDISGLLLNMGHFGRYQTFIFIFTAFPALIAGCVALQNVFILGVPKHRCFIDGCDNNFNQSSMPTFDSLSAFSANPDPFGNTCSRVKTLNSSAIPANCNSSYFESSPPSSPWEVIKCPDSYVYEREEFTETVSSEWNLVCDKKIYLTIASSVFMMGNLFGSLVFGICSDRFGRRSIYYWSPILGASAAMLASFSNSFYLFTFAIFFIAMTCTGSYMIGFVLGVEFIGPKYRLWAANGYQMMFALGEIFAAMVAYRIRHWRSLELIYGCFIATCIALPFILPESVRWLSNRNKKEKAKEILRNVAKWNRREDMLTLINATDLDYGSSNGDSNSNPRKNSSEKMIGDQDGGSDRQSTPTKVEPKQNAKGESSSLVKDQDVDVDLLTLIKHPVLRRWSLNLFYNWAANAMVYYGLSLSASKIGDGLSVYTTFMLLAGVEIPFIIAITIVMQYYGRRVPLAGCMILGSIICLLPAVLPEKYSHATVILGVLGKGCITASFALVYFYTAEIYPTVMRSVGVGTCSTMARIGAMIAPFVAEFSALGKNGPMIICGVVSLVAGILALDLPETHNRDLPETVDDVYKLQRRKSCKPTKGGKPDESKIQIVSKA